jgi:hypothetical protein
MYCHSVPEPSPERLPGGASSRVGSGQAGLMSMPNSRQPACVPTILYAALTLRPRLACRNSRLEAIVALAVNARGAQGAQPSAAA